MTRPLSMDIRERLVRAVVDGGMTAPMVLDGAMHGPAFLSYVEQVLVPTLSAGDVVVMDRFSDLPQNRLHELLPWNWKGRSATRNGRLTAARTGCLRHK